MNTNFSQTGSELLQQGISIRFPARGHSMHPVIRDSDVVQVDPVSSMRIKPGDIVLCSLERGVVLHRVKGTTGTAFLICGDSLGSTEEMIAADAISGRVRWIERNGRRIFLDSFPERIRWRLRSIYRDLRRFFARI